MVTTKSPTGQSFDMSTVTRKPVSIKNFSLSKVNTKNSPVGAEVLGFLIPTIWRVTGLPAESS